MAKILVKLVFFGTGISVKYADMLYLVGIKGLVQKQNISIAYENDHDHNGCHVGLVVCVLWFSVKFNKNLEKLLKFSTYYIGLLLFGYSNMRNMIKMLENQWT